MSATARGVAKPMRILALAAAAIWACTRRPCWPNWRSASASRLGRRFDLIAGTSVGAIPLLALAFEVPMTRVCDCSRAAAREVFSRGHGRAAR